MFSSALKETVNEWLKINIDLSLQITSISPLSGGSINEAYRINTTSGNYFIKFNNAIKYPGMFDTELKGLRLLESTHTVSVPKVFHSGTSGDFAYIILNFEEQLTPASNYWILFAHELCALHRMHNSHYGLDYDNYIGSLPQSNVKSTDFYEFMILNRFQPLVKSASDNRMLTREDINRFDLLYNKLDRLLPSEKPSLIHGDLWRGNLITNNKGNPCLIDPAVYYGHRETDIAMTKLFGGFPEKFYQSYNSIWPLENGWEERIALHQLYPLLVHVNLFGEGYAYDVRRILKHYIA